MNKIAKALGYILYSFGGGGTATLWNGALLDNLEKNSCDMWKIIF